QNVALHLDSIVTVPAGIGVGIIVYQPSGAGLVSAPNLTTPTTINLPNLAAGTYSVLVAPRNAATGSAQLVLANGAGGALTANGSTQSVATTVPQQHAYFSFSATAGDDLGLALTNLVITPNSPNYVRVYVVRPSGYALVNAATCGAITSPGCWY